jgi:hypothetical protein
MTTRAPFKRPQYVDISSDVTQMNAKDLYLQGYSSETPQQNPPQRKLQDNFSPIMASGQVYQV